MSILLLNAQSLLKLPIVDEKTILFSSFVSVQIDSFEHLITI